MSQEELDSALQEGHYHFTLQDVTDYMILRGEVTVLQDILRVYQHKKTTKKSKRVTLNTDSPF